MAKIEEDQGIPYGGGVAIFYSNSRKRLDQEGESSALSKETQGTCVARSSHNCWDSLFGSPSSEKYLEQERLIKEEQKNTKNPKNIRAGSVIGEKNWSSKPLADSESELQLTPVLEGT